MDSRINCTCDTTEAESKEKHGVWDPMPELTYLTLCPLQSRLQHIYHRQLYVRVDFVPQSETLHLASVLYCMWDIGDRVDVKYGGGGGW